MKMRFLSISLLLLLAGCATLSNRDRDVLRAHDVPPSLYEKMSYGEPLDAVDAIVLTRHRVPPVVVIHYIDDNAAAARVSRVDVKRMRDAGVDESVISHMLALQYRYFNVYAAPGYYPYPYYGPYYGGPYGYGYDPYFYPGPVVYRSWDFGVGWRHGDGDREGEGHHHHHRD